jgi:hypothetical protein
LIRQSEVLKGVHSGPEKNPKTTYSVIGLSS